MDVLQEQMTFLQNGEGENRRIISNHPDSQSDWRGLNQFQTHKIATSLPNKPTCHLRDIRLHVASAVIALQTPHCPSRRTAAVNIEAGFRQGIAARHHIADLPEASAIAFLASNAVPINRHRRRWRQTSWRRTAHNLTCWQSFCTQERSRVASGEWQIYRYARKRLMVRLGQH
jgi:hypothetical protein